MGVILLLYIQKFFTISKYKSSTNQNVLCFFYEQYKFCIRSILSSAFLAFFSYSKRNFSLIFRYKGLFQTLQMTFEFFPSFLETARSLFY